MNAWLGSSAGRWTAKLRTSMNSRPRVHSEAYPLGPLGWGPESRATLSVPCAVPSDRIPVRHPAPVPSGLGRRSSSPGEASPAPCRLRLHRRGSGGRANVGSQRLGLRPVGVPAEDPARTSPMSTPRSPFRAFSADAADSGTHGIHPHRRPAGRAGRGSERPHGSAFPTTSPQWAPGRSRRSPLCRTARSGFRSTPGGTVGSSPKLIGRARDAGYEAIMLTVDTAVLGRRGT